MSDKNTIILNFDKADTRLAGNPYGKTIYNEQVKKVINYDKVNVIYFPDNIEKIASSFVQGFFSEIISNIGYDGAREKIELKAQNELIVENMWKDLLM